MNNIKKLRCAVLVLFTCATVGCEYALDNDDLQRRGTSALRAGEFRAAAIDLRNLVQNDPTNAEGRALLAETLIETGDVSAALAEAEKSSELGVPASRLALVRSRALLGLDRPQDALLAAGDERGVSPAERAKLDTVRADSHARLHRYAEARAFYGDAIASDPAQIAAWSGLAMVTYELEGAAAANEVLQRATKAAGDAPMFTLARGAIENRERRFGEGEATFRAVLEQAEAASDSLLASRALAGLVESELGLGRGQDAYATASRLFVMQPASIAAAYLKARASFVLASYDEARELLEQLLARHPGHVSSKLLLGAVNYAQGNLGQADMYLSSVVAAEPGNSFARRLLAEVRMRDRKPEAALAVLAEGVLDEASRGLAARIRLQSGDVAGGLKLLEEGAAAKPEDRAAQLELANGYLSAGQLGRSLAVLESLPPSAAAPDLREYLLIFVKARQKDYPGAIGVARELIDRHRDAIPLYIALATLENLSGRADDARRTLDAALKVAPASASALLALAQLDLAANAVEAAEKRALQALENHPKLTPAAIALAQVAAARNDTAAAVSWLEKAAEWGPRAAQPRTLLARFHLMDGRFDRAHELAQAAARLAPDDPVALDLLAQTAARVGRTAEALETVKQSAARAQDSVGHQLALARANLSAGRSGEALEAAREAVRLDPQNLQANVLVAALLVQRPDVSEGTKRVAALRRQYPQHPAVLALDGDLAMRGGRFSDAAAAYRAAGERVPEQGLVIREFQARRAAGDPAALAPLDHWLEKHPGDTTTRLVAAQARMEGADAGAARADFERIVAEDPKNAVALNNLAWMYFEAGDERALGIAERAYNLQPKTPAIIDTYAWILAHRGDVGRAVALLQQAVSLDEGNAAIREHLTQAQARGAGLETKRFGG